MQPSAILVFGILTLSAAAGEPTQKAESIDAFIQALDASEPEARFQGALELGDRGPDAAPAVQALVKRLGDDNTNVRAASAWALGRIGPQAKDAIPALVKALSDPGYTAEGAALWPVAAEALGRIGPAAVPALTGALGSSELQVVKGAAGAIHDIGPEAKDAVPALIAVLEKPAITAAGGDNTPDSHGSAMFALIGIGPAAKPAIPALIKLLDSENFHNQYWSCRALAAIGAEAKPAVPDLCRLTKDAVPSVRRHAAMALGKIGSGVGDEGLKCLIAAIEDPLEPVRQDAVVALGDLGSFAQPAIPAIEKALAGDRLAARAHAARSLWQITGETEQALKVLAEAIANPVEAEFAAATLVEIGPAAKPAVPRLNEHLKSTDPLVRLSAAEALLTIEPDSQAAAATIEELKKSDSEEVREDTAKVLKRLKKP